MVPAVDALFLSVHIPDFNRRFTLSFLQDDTCVEYFLDERGSLRHVSQNLILSRDIRAGGIYVSKFYPQLFLEKDAKYLSATCFYLIIQHTAHLFRMGERCPVWLETDNAVFNEFYIKLRSFDFRIVRQRVGERVCLKGQFHGFGWHRLEVNSLSGESMF